MIVTVEELQKYTNVFQDDYSLQQSYIDSAYGIVVSYLGYKPDEYIYSPDNCQLEPTIEIPEIIKLTILRIAALLQIESDSNIGITSKSFADSGTRTFVNTVNFDKYLIQISCYRTIRI